MNAIRSIQALNARELALATPPSASWHADYRDTAYVYIGGLPFDISEGDILTIFSQYGEPTYLNLMRDKQSGKSKGFAWLKYEDQRSTDLAVDNLGGANVLGRVLRVDHARYQRKDGEEEEEKENELRAAIDGGDVGDGDEESEEQKRPMIKEEIELQRLVKEHDDNDPMKEFLMQEKKEEVAAALARLGTNGKDKGERKQKHHHRHHHRDKRERKSRSRSDDERRERDRERHHRRRRSRSH
ncbi:hypothetical protein MMC21_005945 [Puttea exsequens]|nr:hypothetical protein [Puttea exsequens]